MKNSKNSPRQITAKEFAEILQERNRRKAEKEKIAQEKIVASSMTEDERFIAFHAERIKRLMAEKQRTHTINKWRIE